MSEENQTAGQQATGPQFAVQRLYIKDASFEAPNMPGIFTKGWKPEVSLELNNASRRLGDDVYEVVLTLTITVKLEEETAYLVELQQAGIFTISGLGEAELHHTLGAFCPNLLFPYARETVDSMVTKASFPALMLQPVNFDAMYAQQMAQRQANQQAEEAGAEAEAKH